MKPGFKRVELDGNNYWAIDPDHIDQILSATDTTVRRVSGLPAEEVASSQSDPTGSTLPIQPDGPTVPDVTSNPESFADEMHTKVDQKLLPLGGSMMFLE